MALIQGILPQPIQLLPAKVISVTFPPYFERKVTLCNEDVDDVIEFRGKAMKEQFIKESSGVIINGRSYTEDKFMGNLKNCEIAFILEINIFYNILITNSEEFSLFGRNYLIRIAQALFCMSRVFIKRK